MRKTPVRHVTQRVDVDTDSDSGDCLSVDVHKVDTRSSKLYSSMRLGSPPKEHLFQLDNGASVNVISKSNYVDLFHDYELRHLKDSDTTLVMFNKSEMRPLGRRVVRVTNPKDGIEYKVNLQVVGGDYQSILGAKAVFGMGLLSVNENRIKDTVNSVNKPEKTKVATPEASSCDSLNTLLKEYHDVFEGLGKLPGKLHLEVDETVTPVKLPVRKIPLAVKDKVKVELDRLVSLGIIEPVDTPTDWISALVIVTKSNGDLRLCLDPKPLNKALKRNHYPLTTIDDVLPNLQGARLFTVLDAKDGFFQVELDDESSYLTTFGTPFGRFRYKRMPFGISPAPEEFYRRFQMALQPEILPGVESVADDVLVHGKDQQTHDQNLRNLLERCRQTNVKLNKKKVKLSLRQVKYMGHILTDQGLKIDPAKVEAIEKMPKPSDKAGVLRLMGMVNYLQRFAPQLAELSKPVRDLAGKDVEFLWQEHHDRCLEQIKAVLATAPVLGYFDPNVDVTLQCDASDHGLGACLMQEGKPIAYASRAMTSAEVNYAQIEKELLAILYGMNKFEHFTFGRKVLVQSDHKPLETIFRKSLVNAPRRLQRMLLQLQKYELEVVYRPGKMMHLADTLSRAFLPRTETSPGSMDNVHIMDVSDLELEIAQINQLEGTKVSDVRLAEIRTAMETDDQLKRVRSTILAGWPEELSQQMQKDLSPYHTFREELTVENGIILKGERVVVPLACRDVMLERLHASHNSAKSCIRLARRTVYWPNITKNIMDYVQRCTQCNRFQDEQQREPLISTPVPNRSWEIVSLDLFQSELGKHYLITVDHFSDFYEIDKLHDLSHSGIVPKLKAHFARHGVPVRVISDNGPPFGSAVFRQFATDYGFEHVTSSPNYPRSNGKAENAVKQAKKLLKKCHSAGTDPYLALLEQRNIPSEEIGTSPVQRLFGRATRTRLPVSNKQLEPKLYKDTKVKLKQRKEKQKKQHDRSSKPLSELKPGTIVRIRPNHKNQPWRKAIVVKMVAPRSYLVKTEADVEYRRNRRHIKVTNEPWSDDDVEFDFYVPDNDNGNRPNGEVVNTDTNVPRRSQRVGRSARRDDFEYY